MKTKLIPLFLVFSLMTCHLNSYAWAESQAEDPVLATLKAIQMAQKAVEAVQEAAKAVAIASHAIEQAKLKNTIEPEKLALQEENLIKAAQMVVDLSNQASETLREATKTVLAARILDGEHVDEILAVALKEEDFSWLSSIDHLRSIAFYEKDLTDFIETKLMEIKKESPELFTEMTALIQNREEMDVILNKVQSGEKLTDEYTISVFQAVCVAFNNMNEEIALLRGAVYGDPRSQLGGKEEIWQKIEKMQEREERMRDQRLERN